MTAQTPDIVPPAAVLWDMDGTLIDTEPLWQQSQYVLADRFGVTWTHEDGLTLVGSGLDRSGAILRARGIDMEVPEIVQWMTSFVLDRLEQDELPWRPGAKELILELSHQRVPLALVTMSLRRMALAVVNALPEGCFDVVVAGDDVERPKPDPAPYVLAASQLGVDPAACIAIEDSVTGVTSAMASGARTVAVEHLVPLGSVPAHAHLTSLSGVRAETLFALGAKGRIPGVDASLQTGEERA